MRKRFMLLIAASALFLLACDVSSITSQFNPGDIRSKVVQGLSPTEAPTPPPPTPVAQPPSGQPAAGNPFAGALQKAKGAQKFRIESSIVVGSTQNGKYSEEPLIDFSGEVDGASAHFSSKGGIFAALSGGAGSLELIEADGKLYIRGISLFGITDPKVWYVQKDTSTVSGFKDFTKPDSFDSFTGSAKSGDFKKVRTESLDGQSCDVYAYDFKSAQNAALTTLLSTAKDKNEFNAIDKAEMNVWLCGDGYVHKFALEYAGHDQKNAGDKGALKMSSHMSDFGNAAIRITAPQGAKPMPGQ